MAKGQMKSNREKKKPKAAKPATTATANSVTNTFAKPKPGKK
jgi:hypothetical protein